jgi:hypothetical protein
MTAFVKSLVEFAPPISGVLTYPAYNVLATAFEILFANIGRPKYLNIMTELNKIDVGLAMFLPAKLIPE